MIYPTVLVLNLLAAISKIPAVGKVSTNSCSDSLLKGARYISYRIGTGALALKQHYVRNHLCGNRYGLSFSCKIMLYCLVGHGKIKWLKPQ